MSTAPYLCAGALFLLGLYGIITSRDYVHLIGCLSVLQSSTYVLLLSVGFRTGANAPIFVDHSATDRTVDPVVQALVLTDVVVGAAVAALLLCLVVQLKRCRDTIQPDLLDPASD